MPCGTGEDTLPRTKPVPATPVEVGTYTLAETAARLGISRTYAYELVRRGELPVRAFRVGQTWRTRRADVEAFLRGDAKALPS